MTDPDSGDDTDQYAQLEPGDTLDGSGMDDVLDEGYSPPDRPWNDRDDESLDERLADEEPDPWNRADPLDEIAGGGRGHRTEGNEADDAEDRDDDSEESLERDFADLDDETGADLDSETSDDSFDSDGADEVGDRRAGRLTVDDASFDGSNGGEEELVGGDAGIDGAAASAEEAAVHIVGDDER